ncbi:MAG: hypothetical protein WAW85_05840, partial [Gordonia sp. (in: high G+C Gram-positive bacteria)]|uniref:hypothetical protein n=1 Tax=Gordonia sp. (in: high G+C Gram-positive bacteria) TaxID=84139 RepID=UPI003BB5E60F
FGRGWAWGRDATPVTIRRWHVPRERDRFGVPPVQFAFDRGTGFTVSSSTERQRDGRPAVGVDAVDGPYVFGKAELEGIEVTTALRLTGKSALAEGSDGAATWYRHTITFDEDVVEGELYLRLAPLVGAEEELARLLFDHPLTARRSSVFTVLRKSGNEAVAAEDLDGTGIFWLAVRDGVGGLATGVVATLPSWVSVSVVALHALTVADRDAAAAADRHTDEVILAEATGERFTLAPGAHYRIDVALSWKRTYRDRDGTPVTSTYNKDGEDKRTRSWYFQTAAETSTVDPAPWLSLQNVRQFRPEYLQRYLTGFDRPDHADYVFADDRPSASFAVTYLPGLLHQYGRRPVVKVRRTDKPHGSSIDWRKPKIVTTYGAGSPFEKRMQEAAAQSGCPIAPTGSDLAWTSPLETQASYEMTVAFPPETKAPTDTTPQLDGITFRTSAYRNASALIRAMGLYPSSPARPPQAGDVPVIVPPKTLLVAGDRHGDAAVEDVLGHLGVPPQLPPRVPETTVLWVRDGAGWAVLGLWLANPEPIIRAGRLELGSSITISNQHNPSRKAAARYVNGAGSSVLWLLPAPLAASSSGFWFDVTVTDRAPAKNAPSTVVRRARCGRTPAFAGGVLMGGQ